MQVLDADVRVCSIGRGDLRGSTGRGASLACLLDDALATRFHRWCGRSGARYTATVYPIDHDDLLSDLPNLGPAILIAVARHGVVRDIVGVTAIERDSDWTHAVTRLHPGADEWHVHLLATDRSTRAAVLADLVSMKRLAIVA